MAIKTNKEWEKFHSKSIKVWVKQESSLLEGMFEKLRYNDNDCWRMKVPRKARRKITIDDLSGK